MPKPNVVFILADDMGYGDVSALNENCAFKTPNLDRMVEKGLHFTDAHTSSSVCTPSRYSILTGRYCWRTYLKSSVLSGTSKALIHSDRETIASLAKKANYDTACIGKWHLGWDWAIKEGATEIDDSLNNNNTEWIDYNKPIKNSPNQLGFDHFYGISGSLDMPPYVYVENDKAIEEPTAWGESSEFGREGRRMESLRANNVLGHLTDKAVSYIQKHGKEKPFMLYFPITAPHTPIAPAAEFDGKSGINPYADFCLEVDHRVGQVFSALELSGQLENTLVIFTTDNGASAGPSECKMLEEHHQHFCSYIYRGYKSDIWDGGHRIPYLMHWPEGIDGQQRCDQKVGIFDFFASFAELTGVSHSHDSGEDSCSYLPAFKGLKVDENQRHALIHHSINGSFALRHGKWKLCRCAGSGGWGIPRDKIASVENPSLIQLYNMEEDPGEKNNVSHLHPDIVTELTKTLHKCVINGRSTPGKHLDNDTNLDIKDWKQINWLPEIPDQYIVED